LRSLGKTFPSVPAVYSTRFVGQIVLWKCKGAHFPYDSSKELSVREMSEKIVQRIARFPRSLYVQRLWLVPAWLIHTYAQTDSFRLVILLAQPDKNYWRQRTSSGSSDVDNPQRNGVLQTVLIS